MRSETTLKKNIKNLSVPWERAFGYVQGIQAGSSI